MAKNDIHFTHCSRNEPSKDVVIWQVYPLRQASLGLGGVGLVPVDVSLQVVLQ